MDLILKVRLTFISLLNIHSLIVLVINWLAQTINHQQILVINVLVIWNTMPGASCTTQFLNKTSEISSCWNAVYFIKLGKERCQSSNPVRGLLLGVVFSKCKHKYVLGTLRKPPPLPYTHIQATLHIDNFKRPFLIADSRNIKSFSTSRFEIIKYTLSGNVWVFVNRVRNKSLILKIRHKYI